MKNKILMLMIVSMLIYTHASAQQDAERKIAASGTKSALGANGEISAGESNASAAYKDAVALYWDGRLNEAQIKFEQVQSMSPDYARTKYYLGRIKDKQSSGVKSVEEISRSNFTPAKKMDEISADIKAQADARIAKLESERKARQDTDLKARMERERSAVLEKAAQEEARKTKMESEKKVTEEIAAKPKVAQVVTKPVEKIPAVKVTRKQNFTHKDAVIESAVEKTSINTAKKAREEVEANARIERDRKVAEIKSQEDARKAMLESEKKDQEEADTKARMERERNAVMEKAAQEEARKTKLESEKKALEESDAKAIAGSGSDKPVIITAEKPEMTKVKIEVSQQIIDQQMNAYKGNLKEIVREAEANLKKIDGELKEKGGEEAVAKHLKAADEFKAEGKIDEAKAEFKAAMVAASTPAEKRSIKEKERAIDKQAKELDIKKRQADKMASEKAHEVSVRRTDVKTDKKVSNGTVQNITPKLR